MALASIRIFLTSTAGEDTGWLARWLRGLGANAVEEAGEMQALAQHLREGFRGLEQGPPVLLVLMTPALDD